jgi:hypothetical protein
MVDRKFPRLFPRGWVKTNNNIMNMYYVKVSTYSRLRIRATLGTA